MKCPRCGVELPTSGTYCWACEEYLADMAEGLVPLTETTRTAELPDGRLEDQIQEAGRKALELLGFTVYSFSQDRATRQTAGIADTYVAGHGRTTWAEWKRPGKPHPQTAAQIDFEETVTANGDEYHVWRHENDAIAWAKGVIEAEDE